MLRSGIVTHFITDRAFGFIDSEEIKDIFFYLDFSSRPYDANGIRLTAFIIAGYQVEFQLQDSMRSEHKYEARNIRFLSNPQLLALHEKVKNGLPLSGYLKKIGDRYYVKDADTYIFIKLKISPWEIDTEAVYDSRLNKLVPYQTTINEKTSLMNAFLPEKKLSPQYYLLNEASIKGQPVEATITGLNPKGFHATLFEGAVRNFISIPKGFALPFPVKTGDTLLVEVKELSDHNFRVRPFKLKPIT